MLSLTLLILTSSYASYAAEPRSSLWFHLRVVEDDSQKITINLPFSLLERIAPLIPIEEMRHGRISCDGSEVDIADLRQVWTEVQAAEEGKTVVVDFEDEWIEATRKDGFLDLTVSSMLEDDEDVAVRLPEAVVAALFSAGEDRLNLPAAARELVHRGEGELMFVDAEDSTVRMWVDRQPKGGDQR